MRVSLEMSFFTESAIFHAPPLCESMSLVINLIPSVNIACPFTVTAGDRQRLAEGIAGEARERGCGCADLHRRIGDWLIEGLVAGLSHKTARVGGAEAAQGARSDRP